MRNITDVFQRDDVGMLSVSHQDFDLFRRVPLTFVYNLRQKETQGWAARQITESPGPNRKSEQKICRDDDSGSGVASALLPSAALLDALTAAGLLNQCPTISHGLDVRKLFWTRILQILMKEYRTTHTSHPVYLKLLRKLRKHLFFYLNKTIQPNIFMKRFSHKRILGATIDAE